jgi:hypothetical protein
VVQSKAHLAVVSRKSYHVPVKVVLQRGGSAKILNADVLRFVKVTDEEKGDSFMAAQADLYKMNRVLESGVEVVEKSVLYKRAVFLPLPSCIITKVVFADDTANRKKMLVILFYTEGSEIRRLLFLVVSMSIRALRLTDRS